MLHVKILLLFFNFDLLWCYNYCKFARWLSMLLHFKNCHAKNITDSVIAQQQCDIVYCTFRPWKSHSVIMCLYVSLLMVFNVDLNYYWWHCCSAIGFDDVDTDFIEFPSGCRWFFIVFILRLDMLSNYVEYLGYSSIDYCICATRRLLVQLVLG